MDSILVTAIGSFAADVVIKNLGKKGCFIVGCDIYPKEWIVDAYSVDLFRQVPLAVDAENYITAIKNICIENNIKYIIPLTDVEIDVLNSNRECFESDGIIICISPTETIEICRNKYSTYYALQGITKYVNLIPTLSAKQLSSSGDTRLSFPLICKPVDGRSSHGIQRIYSARDLDAFLISPHTVDYILQPIIPGRIVTVDILRKFDGLSFVSVPRLELLRTPNGAGTTVRVFHDEKLNNECARIANHLGVIGCVNFEFIRTDDNHLYFLECNPRFSGGIEFSCMIGYDFVWNHLKCFQNKAIDALQPYKSCFIARKYEEVITSIGEEDGIH